MGIQSSKCAAFKYYHVCSICKKGIFSTKPNVMYHLIWCTIFSKE